MRDNPFSFLHILNPGYKYQKRITGERRYTLVKNRYKEFKEEGSFIQDKNPTLSRVGRTALKGIIFAII